MDDDSGMGFQRKEQPQEQPHRHEYYGGGGGGGKPITFTRTSSFSRVCYSDPNNPGKMICKNQSAGNFFDGNQNKTFRNEAPTEYYERPSFFHNPYQPNVAPQVDNEDNFLRRLHYKIKSFFKSENPQNYPNPQQNQINYHNPYTNNYPSNTYNNNSFHPNYPPQINYHQNFGRNGFGNDPIFNNFGFENEIEDIDKLFDRITRSFFQDPFVTGFQPNTFGDDNDPFSRFFNGAFFGNVNMSPFFEDRDNYSNPGFNQNYTNYDHHNNNFNGFPSQPSNFTPNPPSFQQTPFNPQNNNFSGYNSNFNSSAQFPNPNTTSQMGNSQPIRYRDHKIYDV